MSRLINYETECPGVDDYGRNELSKWAASRTLPAGDVFRARLILALADGESYRQIMAALQTTAPTISRWKLVEPRRVSRGEVEAYLRMLGQESLYVFGLVRREIVEHDVNLVGPGRTFHQAPEEGDELFAGVPARRHALDLAGLHRSNSGLPRFNATSSGAASSPRSPISETSFAATSAPIPNQPNRFVGPTPIPLAESSLTKSLGQLTSISGIDGIVSPVIFI